MEAVLPLRHREKASNLLHMATTKLPVLWITDFVHYMRTQTPMEEALHLWDDLYAMKMEVPTESDQSFLVFLQDIVMEWVVEQYDNKSIVDFYFYNYLLLHFKCIPFNTWKDEDREILLRYLEEHSITNHCPILKRMNLEMRQVCQPQSTVSI